MSATKFRVESGVQMILRLTKKTDLCNFYPKLFKEGPRQRHVIEMYSEDDTSCLISDIICESLIPFELGGKGSGAIIFNTDGKFNLEIIVKVMKQKICNSLSDLSLLDNFLQVMLNNLFIFEIYDAIQLHTTILNLEVVLMNHPNISLIVFDTLTAFYWSEQSFKIMKMDMYVKYLLRVIQKAVKDYKVVTLYTRPHYFSSSKENIENLEPCYEHTSLEHLNYRIQVLYTDNGTHQTTVRTYNEIYKCSFIIQDDHIVWC